MKFCNHCGESIDVNERFCGSCGNTLELSSSNNKDYLSLATKYFKDPVNTIKKIVNLVDMKVAAIMLLAVSALTAYVPYKLITDVTSSVFSGMDMFFSDYSSKIKSEIRSFYFTFLLILALFFVIGGVVIYIYSSVRGTKKDFMKTVSIFVLSAIPAVLSILLVALITKASSLSVILIILGFTLSVILLYSQLVQVVRLPELEAFICLVLVKLASYGLTLYIGFSLIKDKVMALDSLF